MHKADLLRAHITAAIPAFARDPDRFALFIDQGAIRWTATEESAAPARFEYEYQVNLIILDWSSETEGHIDGLMFHVISWVARHQPDLVGTKDGVTFESDATSSTLSDIAIRLKLTETVKVTANVDGSTSLEHQGEPDWFALLDPPLVEGPTPILIDIDNPTDPEYDDIIPPPWEPQPAEQLP